MRSPVPPDSRPPDGGPDATSPTGAAADAAAAAVAVLAAELAELGPPPRTAALPPSSASRDWALSGAMHLTGRPGGPPRLAPGGPASWMRAAVAVAGLTSVLPDPAALLGERAACAGRGRNGPSSVGGAFRALRAADGWLGLSLSRPDDLDLLPALIGDALGDTAGDALGDTGGDTVGDDQWRAVRSWLRHRPAAAAAARAQLLGLPAAVIATRPAPVTRPAVRVSLGGPAPGASPPGSRPAGDRPRPLVVDLSALWAGPLCAHLLGLAGARVIKVESTGRPDGARRGAPAFYDLLHSGHEAVALDFRQPAGRAALHRLVAQADVVVESSRPRALRQLGLNAAGHVAAGTVWVAISAYGRDQPDLVGFGDDVAAAAGLAVDDGDGPYPAGDAIADPLAGATAAAAVLVALRAGRGCLLDVSMRDVAARAAALPSDRPAVVARDGGWWVGSGRDLVPVRPPRARPRPGPAPALGVHTTDVLARLTVG